MVDFLDPVAQNPIDRSSPNFKIGRRVQGLVRLI